MIKLVGHVRPANIKGVALSGGVDSMALLSFLRNHRPRDVVAYFFDHDTAASKEAREFVINYCLSNDITLDVGKLSGKKPTEESWEEFWRNQRYEWLHSKVEESGRYIATAHHLNDVAETYIWSMAHGHPRFIHYQQPWRDKKSKIIRPFLLAPKSELYNWCERHQVPFIEDVSNNDVRFTRNRIRHNIYPEILKINPGFLKTVEKSWKDFYENTECS
jgi:tRNA(Ile)-lysidine synthase